jgi:O-antigen ligase
MTTLNVSDIHATRSQKITDSSLSAVMLAGIAWIAIWLGINSGLEFLMEIPVDMLGWIHFVRTLLPLLILLFILPTLFSSRFSDEFPGATQLWLLYGLIGAAMSILSPEPMQALYWAGCYLAVFAGMSLYLRSGDPLRRAVQLNYLSWFVAAIFLGALMYLARGILFTGAGFDITAYSAHAKMPVALDMAMSRSSGMARFAAIPGVVCFIMIWTARGWRKIPFIAMTCGSAYLIWAFQSRGAMIGFAAAIAFAMLFLGRTPRYIGICLIVLLVAVGMGEIVSQDTYDQIVQHITRGQNTEQVQTMNGRTELWDSAWQFALHNPLGRGAQADRMFIGEHVHNTYLYALLESGFAGAILFAAGLAWAWLMFLRAVRSDVPDELGQRALLIQIGALLAFFTVRSIPEVSGAMYGVDLMVMLPALAYLSLLDRQIS